MKSKLKLILLVTMINLNCVSYFSNFCKVAGGKNTSKKEFVLFIKQVKNYLANLARCLELYLIWVLMEIELLVKRQKQRQRKVKI